MSLVAVSPEHPQPPRRRGRLVRVALPPGASPLIGGRRGDGAYGLVLAGGFPEVFAALRFLLERVVVAGDIEEGPRCR